MEPATCEDVLVALDAGSAASGTERSRMCVPGMKLSFSVDDSGSS